MTSKSQRVLSNPYYKNKEDHPLMPFSGYCLIKSSMMHTASRQALGRSSFTICLSNWSLKESSYAALLTLAANDSGDSVPLVSRRFFNSSTEGGSMKSVMEESGYCC